MEDGEEDDDIGVAMGLMMGCLTSILCWGLIFLVVVALA